MSDTSLEGRKVQATEKIAAAAEKLVRVADQVQAVIDAAGGVEGIRQKLAFLSLFAAKKK